MRLFQDMVTGLAYLHSKEVAHRDIKPENLLMQRVYNTNASGTTEAAEYASADRHSHHGATTSTSTTSRPSTAGATLKSTTTTNPPDGSNNRYRVKIIDFGLSNTFDGGKMLKTACGSPCYAAPELLRHEAYVGPKADVWSLGCVLFAMVAGHLPFEQEDTAKLYEKILTASYTPPKWISPAVRDLIGRMLTVDAEARYGMHDIMRHPWFTQVVPVPPPLSLAPTCEPDLHQGVLAAVVHLGIPREGLVQELLAGSHNSTTAGYYLLADRMLRKGQRPPDRPYDPSAVPAPQQRLATANIATTAKPAHVATAQPANNTAGASVVSNPHRTAVSSAPGGQQAAAATDVAAVAALSTPKHSTATPSAPSTTATSVAPGSAAAVPAFGAAHTQRMAASLSPSRARLALTIGAHTTRPRADDRDANYSAGATVSDGHDATVAGSGAAATRAMHGMHVSPPRRSSHAAPAASGAGNTTARSTGTGTPKQMDVVAESRALPPSAGGSINTPAPALLSPAFDGNATMAFSPGTSSPATRRHHVHQEHQSVAAAAHARGMSSFATPASAVEAPTPAAPAPAHAEREMATAPINVVGVVATVVEADNIAGGRDRGDRAAATAALQLGMTGGTAACQPVLVPRQHAEAVGSVQVVRDTPAEALQSLAQQPVAAAPHPTTSEELTLVAQRNDTRPSHESASTSNAPAVHASDAIAEGIPRGVPSPATTSNNDTSSSAPVSSGAVMTARPSSGAPTAALQMEALRAGGVVWRRPTSALQKVGRSIAGPVIIDDASMASQPTPDNAIGAIQPQKHNQHNQAPSVPHASQAGSLHQAIAQAFAQVAQQQATAVAHVEMQRMEAPRACQPPPFTATTRRAGSSGPSYASSSSRRSSAHSNCGNGASVHTPTGSAAPGYNFSRDSSRVLEPPSMYVGGNSSLNRPKSAARTRPTSPSAHVGWPLSGPASPSLHQPQAMAATNRQQPFIPAPPASQRPTSTTFRPGRGRAGLAQTMPVQHNRVGDGSAAHYENNPASGSPPSSPGAGKFASPRPAQLVTSRSPAASPAPSPTAAGTARRYYQDGATAVLLQSPTPGRVQQHGRQSRSVSPRAGLEQQLHLNHHDHVKQEAWDVPDAQAMPTHSHPTQQYPHPQMLGTLHAPQRPALPLEASLHHAGGGSGGGPRRNRFVRSAVRSYPKPWTQPGAALARIEQQAGTGPPRSSSGMLAAFAARVAAAAAVLQRPVRPQGAQVAVGPRPGSVAMAMASTATHPCAAAPVEYVLRPRPPTAGPAAVVLRFETRVVSTSPRPTASSRGEG